MTRPFQILCLSGGGYLGLYSAAVLRELEREVNEPIGSRFDLIAGTSVGGIIALGLASGASAAEIEAAFQANGHLIFSSQQPAKTSFGRTLNTWRRLTTTTHRPIYRSEPLRNTIRQLVPQDRCIGDLLTRVIIPAVNLSKGKPQVFKTPHHEKFRRDWRLKVEDVALATSAAPTFFPIHEIGSELFTDGGLYANSPDQLALHEALYFLGQDLGSIRMLSVGTTLTSFSWSNATGRNLGWFEWAKSQRLITAMMASQQINVDYVLHHTLGERYVRIDRTPSCEQEVQIGLDVASEVAKQDLLALASASVRDAIANPNLRELLSQRAERPHFFKGS